MKNYRDGGEAILQALRALAVDYIMSSPGSEWGPVWEAMARQTVDGRSGPQFIDLWHETLAVDMAIGYTAYTGRMQAVLVHAGVGLLHGAMAIRSAAEAEIPMLVMSGGSTSFGEQPDLPIEPQWYGGLSVGGADRFVAPIVKHASHVGQTETLYHSVVRGGQLAQRDQMGPVYLDVGLEAMLAEWPGHIPAEKHPPAPKLAPLDSDVEAVAKLVASASSPVILTQMSGRDPRAYAQLVEFAEMLALPVVGARSTVTYANFPSSHPLWQGWNRHDVLDQSDLILLVGTRTPWYPPSRRLGKGAVVAIGSNPFKQHLAYQVLAADHYLEGDLAVCLGKLTEAAKPGKAQTATIETRRKGCELAHIAMAGELAEIAKVERARSEISAVALASVAAEVFPSDTIYVDETITHMAAMRPHLPLDQPQSFFRVTGGALGQGIACALGIKLAARDRPVVLFVGDGSFLYNPITQALGAAQAYDVPIVIVICNNRRYEAMRLGHVHHYPDGVAATNNLHFGVHINGPDYQQLGAAFGCHGAKLDTVNQLRDGLKSALASAQSGRTALVNILLSR